MIAILAFLGVAAALETDFSDSSWKERPITKVVGLLKDMQSQLEKEAKENQAITDLTAAIESLTAKSAQLETEIEKLNKDIAKNTAALEQATEIRDKESAEFQAEEKDMMASAASLGGAVEALGKAHPGAALPQESLMQVRAVLRRHLDKHHQMFAHLKKHRVVMALLQEQSSLSTATPASGAIFGILKQMKEGFETNLADSQKDEATAAAAYAELKAAKEKEIGAAEDLSETKSVELADAGDKLAQSKQDLEDTTAQLAADTKFLENLKAKCATAGEEYDARVKVRGEEIQAVSETIGILTDDEAQQAFSKSSFLQLSMRVRRMSAQERRRDQAARLLRRAGVKVGSAQLLKLANQVGGPKDAIKKVVTQIDAQIAELKKIQQEEYEKNNYCKDEIKKNEKDTKAKNGLKADLEQKIEDLTATSTKLGEEIVAQKAAVAAMQVEMKTASENREQENKDFQVTVQDQKATQVILNKALDKLKSFYEKMGLLQKGFSLALLQQTPPPKQAEYKKSGGATAVMMMIEGIINESKDVEAKALKAENDAQADYETFIKDTNDSIA